MCPVVAGKLAARKTHLSVQLLLLEQEIWVRLAQITVKQTSHELTDPDQGVHKSERI